MQNGAPPLRTRIRALWARRFLWLALLFVLAGVSLGIVDHHGLAAGTDLARGKAEPATTLTVQGTTLRLPRFLRNPEIKQLGPGSSVVFRRTTDDTCGLYTWGEFTVAAGQGAPPHLHYGDEEWFIPTQAGKIRMFSPAARPRSFANGQLPGHNLPAETMGSVEIDKQDVFYSPRANIHYFTNENDTPIEGFLNIWAPGFGIRNMFDSFKAVNFRFSSTTEFGSFSAEQQQSLLEATGLWGVPHDTSGKMVGRPDFVRARGAITPHPANLAHLQELIDAGEACYPMMDS